MILALTWLLKDFLVPLITGSVFAILLYKPYVYLMNRYRLSATRSALLITFLFTILVFVPFGILIFMGAKSAAQNLPVAIDYFEKNLSSQVSLNAFLANLPIPIDWLQSDQIEQSILEILKNIGGTMAQGFGAIASEIPKGALAFVLFVASFAIQLIESDTILNLLKRHSPLSASKTEQYMKFSNSAVTAVVLATFATALAQASLFTLGCLFAGVTSLTVVWFVTFVFSFVPVVGALPATLGITVFQFLSQNYTAGFILLVFLFLTSLVDNVVRPLVLKSGADLNPVLGIVAVLGGVSAFGFAGVFLGPLMAVMTIELYKLVYTQET